MQKVVFAVAAGVALLLAATATAEPGRGASQSGRFMVGFDRAPGASERALIARHGGSVVHEFPSIDVLAVSLEDARVGDLARERGVSYVEVDGPRYPLGLADAQISPSLSNGLYGLIRTRAVDAHTAGFTGIGVKACVVDTGVDYTHPDIAGNYVGGVDFVNDDTDPWWNNPGSQESHGTHVAGTILAVNNAAGVLGVAYNAKLLHARVLTNTGGSTSDVMAGADWCRDNGAKVINMSLGGGFKSRSEENLYKDIDAGGVLIVAAAGNDGAGRLSYPAAYANIVSVSAIDVNNQIASFSNTGRGLDVAGPGVLVLSSVPGGMGAEASVTAGGTDYRAFGMEFAGKTSGITGPLVNCGLGDSTTSCGGAAPGFVALIQRGTISFADKVTNVTAQGAAAAIIYNNAPGDFTGTLGAAGSWIPTVSVSDATGAALLPLVGSSATVVNQASSWDHFDGTSMATPHVSGVAALVFSKNASYSDETVEKAIKDTALDLGAAGYDTTYGSGLPQADAAINAAP
jgi:serine protease